MKKATFWSITISRDWNTVKPWTLNGCPVSYFDKWQVGQSTMWFIGPVAVLRLNDIRISNIS